MNKYTIGILFISGGLFYSLLAWDAFYNLTLGKLIEYDLIKIPKADANQNPISGYKIQIIAYGLVAIGIGLYIIFFSNL